MSSYIEMLKEKRAEKMGKIVFKVEDISKVEEVKETKPKKGKKDKKNDN
jgi:proteasome assembly chaperone (PAC2) family protein